jgi:hypothetical protein
VQLPGIWRLRGPASPQLCCSSLGGRPLLIGAFQACDCGAAATSPLEEVLPDYKSASFTCYELHDKLHDGRHGERHENRVVVKK